MRGRRWIAEVQQAGKWVVYLPPKQARCCHLLTTKPSPPGNITTVILPFRGASTGELCNFPGVFHQADLQSQLTMAQWEDFSHIFSFNKKYSYDVKVVDQIISNRKALENQLFADRLLGLAGITGGKGNESFTASQVNEFD
jgi:hypothetical protein